MMNFSVDRLVLQPFVRIIAYLYADLYHFCLTSTTADTTSSEFPLYKSLR
jgi:hypothetical protein